MEHWRRALPLPVLEVDYEETVADREAVARRLVAWCGLDWEPGCLAFHEGKRPVRTACVSQVRQPVYKHSVARWKPYESALCALFDRLEHRSAVATWLVRGPCGRHAPPVWRVGLQAPGGGKGSTSLR
jgi:hypothetical protein